jgi:hypothetical protein
MTNGTEPKGVLRCAQAELDSREGRKHNIQLGFASQRLSDMGDALISQLAGSCYASATWLIASTSHQRRPQWCAMGSMGQARAALRSSKSCRSTIPSTNNCSSIASGRSSSGLSSRRLTTLRAETVSTNLSDS